MVISFWLAGLLAAVASGVPASKVPAGVILVKGAVPAASDRSTPLPEEGSVRGRAYENSYFGLTYPLPTDWTEQLKGPPPSESGSYVLAMLTPSEKLSAEVKGSILVSAQDLFFNRIPATSAMELVRYTREHMQKYQEEERAPSEVMIGGRPFVRFDYGSSLGGLHWSLLATEVRCHVVQFVFTGRDRAALDVLAGDLARVKFPAGGDLPACVADYATPANVLTRVEPVLPKRFNDIPVRILIDRTGKVTHVHVISAFPDQSAAITQALLQWRFKPYVVDGKAREVETGIRFGTPLRRSS